MRLGYCVFQISEEMRNRSRDRPIFGSIVPGLSRVCNAIIVEDGVVALQANRKRRGDIPRSVAVVMAGLLGVGASYPVSGSKARRSMGKRARIGEFFDQRFRCTAGTGQLIILISLIGGENSIAVSRHVRNFAEIIGSSAAEDENLDAIVVQE